MASLGGAFAGLLGNQFLEQLVEFQLVGQLVGSALAPAIQEAASVAWGVAPTAPLSPADAAEAVVRTAMTKDAAAAEARLSGVSPERFAVMELLAGDAPAPEAMAEALRRNFTDEAGYQLGIAQGRLRPEYADLIKKLATQDPTPTTALLAFLKAQDTHDAAQQKYQEWGGNPQWFDYVYNVEGAGPSPLEAAEAARRGIIGWTGTGAGVTSFEQAVHESAYRNKWLAVFQALSVYLPPPRTIVAMLKEGALTTTQASDLLTKAGLPPDLVQAYLTAASAQKTAGAKDLAQSTIRTLYQDRLVTKAQASTMLQNMGYSQAEAGYLLAIVDAQLAQRFLSSAVGRVHTRYTSWKITKATASTALTDLGVDATGVSDLMSLWDIERSTNQAVLTASQVAKAWHDGIITQDAATTRLEEHGYSADDAWLFLSQYQGAPAPNRPPGV